MYVLIEVYWIERLERCFNVKPTTTTSYREIDTLQPPHACQQTHLVAPVPIDVLGGQEEHGGICDVVKAACLHFEHPDLVAGAKTVLHTP